MDITWPSVFALSLPLMICLVGALIVFMAIANSSRRRMMITFVCVLGLAAAAILMLPDWAVFHFRGAETGRRSFARELQNSHAERWTVIGDITTLRDSSANGQSKAPSRPPSEKNRPTDSNSGRIGSVGTGVDSLAKASDVAPDEANEPPSNGLLARAVVTPKERPEWVEMPPKRSGEPHTTAVASGLYSTFEECQGALKTQVDAATADYVDWYLESTGRGSHHDLVYCPSVTVDFSLGPKVHRETVEFDFGTMRQIHVLLEFGDEYRQRLERCWNDTEIARRLVHVGFLALGSLSLLSTLYIYLKLDDATHGRYAGRLQFIASGVILALVGSGVLIARWIPWM